jgi:sugar lactone lactonase YvrE
MKSALAIWIVLASVPAYLLGTDTFSTERLPAPEKTVALSWNFAGQPIPRWQQGMLLGHRADNGDVVVVGRDGQIKIHAKLWPDGAQRVSLQDVTVSPSGEFVVAGSAMDAAGAWSAWLAWLDSGGRAVKYVTLNPAAALGVAFAPDGTLWALVRVHDDRFNELRDYDMLRHYSAGGRLLSTALARGSFAYGGTYPAWSPCFTVTADRVGFLSNRTNEWIEVSPESGKLLLRWRLPSTLRAGGVRIDSVAMTPDDAVYFNTSKQVLRPGEQQEFGVYRLDRRTGVAAQVDFSAVRSGGRWLSILVLAARTADWSLARISSGCPGFRCGKPESAVTAGSASPVGPVTPRFVAG